MPDEVPGMLSDEQLACRARQGCAASFEHLMRRFQTPVLHFLQHRGAGADAEDLLQETFLRAYTNLSRYESKWRFAAWLFTIARRTSINHHRRARAVADAEALEAVACRAPGPPEMAAAEEGRQRLWCTAARVLSEDEVTALWLYYVEDLSAREIAAVLDRSWIAVKTMLYRARRRLSPWLEETHCGGRTEDRSLPRDRRQALTVPGVEVPHV